MEKTAKIKQLIDSRTALLDAVAGLCDEEFDAGIGVSCQSLKARLAHIAVADWEMAKLIRETVSVEEKPTIGWFAPFDRQEVGDLVEQRCRCSSTEIVSEVVLSLQALLAELRPLADHHFVTPVFTPGAAEGSPDFGVARVVESLLRATEQQCEEIRAWRFQ